MVEKNDKGGSIDLKELNHVLIGIENALMKNELGKQKVFDDDDDDDPDATGN